VPAAKTKQQLISNEVAFERYRLIVESDLRNSQQVDNSTKEALIAGYAMGAWGNRYSRRRNVLEGRPGWADPLADLIACRMIMQRNRRLDAEFPIPPGLGGSMNFMLELAYANTYGLKIGEPHAHGPSIRRLWGEAIAKGGSELDAWKNILAWGQHRPGSFRTECERSKGGLPPLGPDTWRLEHRLDWGSTGELDVPWRADVEGAQWQVRLNDFPDAVMYSLLVDGQEIGDFHDWPPAWAREGQPAAAETSSPRTAPHGVHRAADRWLDRYKRGEQEKVWAELIELGPDIRNRVHIEPARAVAHETMRRARTNVELLVPRLRSLGYQFHTPRSPSWTGNPLVLVGRGTLATVHSLSDLLGEVGSLRQKASGAGAGMSAGIEALSAMLARLVGERADKPTHIGQTAEHNPDIFVPASPDTAERIRGLEGRGLVLPLSLQAWLCEVGRVDLSGSHPVLCPVSGSETGILADPLSIIPMIDEVEEETEGWRKRDGLATVPLFMGFAPDEKAALEAGDEVGDNYYELLLPDPAADVPLTGEADGRGFVQYLRLAFQFGGFPGWAREKHRPEMDLKQLTYGLLSI
jgi:hypothetical protein